MPTSLIDADSLLAVDVGAITTRAMLFDVVDGRYRFLASGSAPTTAGAPFSDIGEGVRRSIDQLQAITGRTLIDEDERLILPSQPNGSGIDTCVATLSVGKPLRVVAVGLLEDVSSESALRLASTTYAQVVDRLSLNDRRKTAAQIDSILRVRPDLIIVAGGIEGGASQSVLSLLEPIGLACYLIHEDQRPEILYAGNQALVESVDSTLSGLARLSVAPNVRPTLEVEQLSTAQNQLADIYRSVRVRSIPGVHELDAWSGGGLLPTATAFGRMLRFLSHVYDPAKGVLGVDVGASSVAMGAAFTGDLYLGVYPDLGLGERLDGILKSCTYEEITRWLPFEVSEAELQDYIYNKKIHPASLPVTKEELGIEQALARQAISAAAARLSGSFPLSAARSSGSLLPWFEPIVAAGSVLTNAPNRGQSLLMLLDGLQPTGVTTVVLDQHNLMAALGAAAAVNSILPIQVLESNTFLNLGTVISVISHAAFGSPAVRVRVSYESGNESVVDIKHGALEIIPLPSGKAASLQLQPLNRSDVGLGGSGRGGSVRVTGGALGVIVDARGRPLRLSKDAGRRRDLIKKWLWSLGG